jgi:hypothetical protein
MSIPEYTAPGNQGKDQKKGVHMKNPENFPSEYVKECDKTHKGESMAQGRKDNKEVGDNDFVHVLTSRFNEGHVDTIKDEGSNSKRSGNCLQNGGIQIADKSQ